VVQRWWISKDGVTDLTWEDTYTSTIADTSILNVWIPVTIRDEDEITHRVAFLIVNITLPVNVEVCFMKTPGNIPDEEQAR
jgi:hypothetical protein